VFFKLVSRSEAIGGKRRVLNMGHCLLKLARGALIASPSLYTSRGCTCFNHCRLWASVDALQFGGQLPQGGEQEDEDKHLL
jgi:hypothetical protein